MEVRSTLNPGEKGTENPVQKYGEKLDTVRYRYAKAKGMRYKSVVQQARASYLRS